MKKVFAILLASVLILSSMLLTNTTYGTMKSEKITEVSPNVNHIQRTYQNNTTPQSVNILDINLVNDFTRIEVGLPKTLNTLSRTSLTAANNSYEGHRVVGAVNAAFFKCEYRQSFESISN